MDEQKQINKPSAKDKKPDKKEQAKREAEIFKRRYFDYYDDVKISVKEDW